MRVIITFILLFTSQKSFCDDSNIVLKASGQTIIHVIWKSLTKIDIRDRGLLERKCQKAKIKVVLSENEILNCEKLAILKAEGRSKFIFKDQRCTEAITLLKHNACMISGDTLLLNAGLSCSREHLSGIVYRCQKDQDTQ